MVLACSTLMHFPSYDCTTLNNCDYIYSRHYCSYNTRYDNLMTMIQVGHANRLISGICWWIVVKLVG